MFTALQQRIRTLSHGFPPVGPWLFVLCVLVVAGAMLVLSQTRQPNSKTDAFSTLFQKTPQQFQGSLDRQAAAIPKIKEVTAILADHGLPVTMLWNVFHVETAALFLTKTEETTDFSLVWRSKNPAAPTEKLVFFTLSRLYPGIKKGLLEDETLISTYFTGKTNVLFEPTEDGFRITLPTESKKPLFFHTNGSISVLSSSTTTPVFISNEQTANGERGVLEIFWRIADFLSYPF